MVPPLVSHPQVFRSTQYMGKYIGGFDTSKQRRQSDSTTGPIQLIEPDRQRRALGVILRVLGGEEAGGGASFLPGGEAFQNMAVYSGVCDASLEQYCYALKPIDILGEVRMVTMPTRGNHAKANVMRTLWTEFQVDAYLFFSCV